MNIKEIKERYAGKNIVLCGSAPSLNQYAREPIEDAYHVALNKAFLKEGIDFDSVISCDYTGIRDIENILEERQEIIKIMGLAIGPPESIMPEKLCDDSKDNIVKFYVKNRLDQYDPELKFESRVDEEPVVFAASVAVAAIQILLWCKPDKLYLAGLDFTADGHYAEINSSEAYLESHKAWASTEWRTENIRTIWKNIKKFADENYFGTSIISINPVNLKGIFEDFYYHPKNPKVTAYIAVKANSVRLPGKNILPFADTNLLIYKIRQLRQVYNISEIVVSTDSDEMLKMAEEEGAVGIARPKDLADESRPYADFVEYLTRILPGKHIIRCPVTAPLCDANVISDSIDKYFDALDQGYDSLTSVTKFQSHMLDENGPMNFSTGIDHKGSQNLPVWYEIANCMDIEPIEIMKKYHFQYGPKVYKYEVDPVSAVDIDDLTDYRMACAIYKYWKDNDLIIGK